MKKITFFRENNRVYPDKYAFREKIQTYKLIE